MAKKKIEAEGKDKGPVAHMMSKRFMEERKIFLWGAVADKNCQEITQQLLFLDMEEPGKEITFYINTPGGSVTAGLAVYDTIKMIKSPVSIVVTGMAASMGSIFLASGTKGRRFLFPHAKVLLHQPLISGMIQAPAIDINIHAQEMEKTRDEINLILSEASGQPLEKIRQDTDRDFYLNAKQTIEYGLADKILSSL